MGILRRLSDILLGPENGFGEVVAPGYSKPTINPRSAPALCPDLPKQKPRREIPADDPPLTDEWKHNVLPLHRQTMTGEPDKPKYEKPVEQKQLTQNQIWQRWIDERR